MAFDRAEDEVFGISGIIEGLSEGYFVVDWAALQEIVTGCADGPSWAISTICADVAEAPRREPAPQARGQESQCFELSWIGGSDPAIPLP